MALPEEFNSFEHLQSVLRRTHNEIVREEFLDILDDDDISTPRSSLKTACLMTDNDPDSVQSMRLWLFYVIVRKAQDFQTPIYGIPTPDYQSTVKFEPQVKLYFSQDRDSVPQGRSPVTSQIQFRIRNETSQTLSEGELRAIAQRIKSEFAGGSNYRWSRGEVLVTYRDLERGLNLKLYALSKGEAVQVIQKVCDCASVPYDADFLVTHTSERTYPNNPGSISVLGRSRNRPVTRPTAFVRFRWASVSVWGLPNDIYLVADRFSSRNPLEFTD